MQHTHTANFAKLPFGLFIIMSNLCNVFKCNLFASLFRKDHEKRAKILKYKEVGKRLHVGKEKIPSICFYTFLHSTERFVFVCLC